MITIKTKDGVIHKYSINEITQNCYEIDLHDGSEWYSGKSPVFTSVDNAFIFVLKIMSWVNYPIDEITSDCTFLDKAKITALCQNKNITVNCY